MTGTRLTGLVLGLWALLMLLMGAIAVNAAHVPPSEFLMPGRDPLSWVVPALAVAPPLLLALAHRARPARLDRVEAGLAILLAGALAALLLLFSPSAYLGS